MITLALAFLAFLLLCAAYFVVATALGVYTGLDPFLGSTPAFYRVFLWPAAKIWNAILPGLGGSE